MLYGRQMKEMPPTSGFRCTATFRSRLVIFLALFASYLYFTPVIDNDNVITRIGLSISIVVDRVLSINQFAPYTVDRAIVSGRVYSDKAPGLSFMAIPPTAVTLAAARLFDIPFVFFTGPETTTTLFDVIVGLSTAVTSGMFTALAAASVLSTACLLTGRLDGALFAALCFGLGTIAWGWATAFFGHATAGACLFLAYSGIVRCTVNAPRPAHPLAVGVYVGALLGWAFVVEFTTAPAVLVLAAFAFWTGLRCNAPERCRLLVGGSAAAFLGTSPLWIHNALAFGSPLQLGYQSVVGFPGMQQGLFGISIPRLSVGFELLLGQHRGIFWVSPVLLVTPIALAAWLRSGEFRRCLLPLIGVIGAYLAINAGYHYWDGGMSTGPRHLVPVLPFVSLPLAFLWVRSSRRWKYPLAALALLSILISLVCVSVDVTAPEYERSPLFDYLLPSFMNGTSRALLGRISVPSAVCSLLLGVLWLVVGFTMHRAWKTAVGPSLPGRGAQHSGPLRLFMSG
jgi:hypothetical protein